MASGDAEKEGPRPRRKQSKKEKEERDTKREQQKKLAVKSQQNKVLGLSVFLCSHAFSNQQLEW